MEYKNLLRYVPTKARNEEEFISNMNDMIFLIKRKNVNIDDYIKYTQIVFSCILYTKYNYINLINETISDILYILNNENNLDQNQIRSLTNNMSKLWDKK
jgi:hypothetical protein